MGVPFSFVHPSSSVHRDSLWPSRGVSCVFFSFPSPCGQAEGGFLCCTFSFPCCCTTPPDTQHFEPRLSHLGYVSGPIYPQFGRFPTVLSRSTRRFRSSLLDPSLISTTESSPQRSWLASWNSTWITSIPSPSSLPSLHTCSAEPTLP